jgi:hypothetical protein
VYSEFEPQDDGGLEAEMQDKQAVLATHASRGEQQLALTHDSNVGSPKCPVAQVPPPPPPQFVLAQSSKAVICALELQPVVVEPVSQARHVVFATHASKDVQQYCDRHASVVVSMV